MKLAKLIGLAARLSASSRHAACFASRRSSPGRNRVAAIRKMYDKVAQDAHNDLKGIVILRNGRLVSERYFNGHTVTALHDIRSATKSITSALICMAMQKKAWFIASRTQ